ncbi:hypothetical protein LOK49_LG11G00825 [Camellia lanceoleosa]|uniref:Uncharacterized protein n=1 Tax=Camellia lanceoleosa TaxID=1840588 RepID=A0ACC0FZZ2_9ERIC|nr:hypothetical protein LOK49_LG11G00825 [Camellia lanceoleosa]
MLLLLPLQPFELGSLRYPRYRRCSRKVLLSLLFIITTRKEAILIAEGFSYSGAKGDIKVWNPFVESDDEYSASQFSLKNGPYMKYEGIESGWAVNPFEYGDRKTRLFVYWSASHWI